MPLTATSSQETDFERWSSHVWSTLFRDDEQQAMCFDKAMRQLWHDMEVTACRTQANRYYHVCCRHCGPYVYGEYGNNNTAQEKQQAQDALLRFVGAEMAVQRERREL